MIIDRKKFLFFSPEMLERSEKVILSVCPPEDRRVVIESDKPWENQAITFYTTYIFDGEKHRLYYTCRDKDKKANLALAISDDGYNFEKPDFNHIEYKGSKHNNLVGIGTTEDTIIYEPDSHENERYKCFTHHNGVDILVHTSPDGICWNISKNSIFKHFCDSQNIAFFDKRIGKYVFYLRGWDYCGINPGINPKATIPTVSGDKTLNLLDTETLKSGIMRTVKRGETDSLFQPIKPQFDKEPITRLVGEQPIVNPEFQTVISRDEFDGAQTDIYTSAVCPYEDYYIAFPSLYRHYPEDIFNDGLLESHFAASLDGKTWQRFDRKPYVRNEVVGRFACNMAFIGPGYGIFGDKILQYGTVYHRRHGQLREMTEKPDGRVVCYEQRKDGFVAAVFAVEGGSFVSSPWICKGGNIAANLDTGMNGSIKFQVADENFKPEADFTFDDCEEICDNITSRKIIWKGGSLDKLSGKPIRIFAKGKSTRLFALEFSK